MYISRIVSTLALCLSVAAIGCSSKDNKEVDPPGYNTQEDPSSLGYFNLPKEGDSRLLNKEDIPQAQYTLVKIQSFTIAYPSKMAVAFEQKLSTAGRPRSGDKLNFDIVQGSTDGKEYQLTSQLNMPLSFSASGSDITFDTVREYWNKVYTSNDRAWALNSKPDATAKNPSIEETLKHSIGEIGTYSHISSKTTRNTVWLTVEDDNHAYIYLRTQLKSETFYIRLTFKPDRDIVHPGAPTAKDVTQ